MGWWEAWPKTTPWPIYYPKCCKWTPPSSPGSSEGQETTTLCLADNVNRIYWKVVDGVWVALMKPNVNISHVPPPGPIPADGTTGTTLALEPADNIINWRWHIGEPTLMYKSDGDFQYDSYRPVERWGYYPCYLYHRNFDCCNGLPPEWEITEGTGSLIDSVLCANAISPGVAYIKFVGGTDDVQTLTLTTPPANGTYRIIYKSRITYAITDFTAAALQTALRSLHSDLVNCTVSLVDSTFTVTIPKESLVLYTNHDEGRTPGLFSQDYNLLKDALGNSLAFTIVHVTVGVCPHWTGDPDGDPDGERRQWNQCDYGCQPDWPNSDGTDGEQREVACTCGYRDQARWRKSGSRGSGQWELLEDNCRPAKTGETIYGEPTWDCPACEPLKPTTLDYNDGDIVVIDCRSPKKLSLGTGSVALVNYGKEKYGDLFVAVRVCAGVGDEVRIVFDGGNQYAYFKIGDNTMYHPAEMGIFDGTTLHKRTAIVAGLIANDSGGQWLCLWLQRSEVEGETRQVARAIVPAIIDGYHTFPIDFAGVASFFCEHAIYVPEVTDHRVGVGTGTSSSAQFDCVRIFEGKRRFDDSVPLPSWHPCYMPHIVPFDETSSMDPFWFCPGSRWSAVDGFGCSDCIDAVFPDTVKVRISGVTEYDPTGIFGCDGPCCSSYNSLNDEFLLDFWGPGSLPDDSGGTAIGGCQPRYACLIPWVEDKQVLISLDASLLNLSVYPVRWNDDGGGLGHWVVAGSSALLSMNGPPTPRYNCLSTGTLVGKTFSPVGTGNGVICKFTAPPLIGCCAADFDGATATITEISP